MKRIDFVVGKPIPQPDRAAESDLLKLLFISLLVAVPLLVYVALSVSYMAIDYQISELIKQKEELKRERALLLLEKEKLLNLASVEEIASSKLGMVRENPTEIRASFDEDIVKDLSKRGNK